MGAPSLEAIKSRIRALLAKTVANGCTEGEALAAAEKAFAIMREHGLSEDQLDFGRTGSSLGRSKRHAIDDLWPHVALVCRCKCLLVQTEDSLRFDFVGQKPWPEIADWLRQTLQAAHKRALADYRQTPVYLRRRKTRTRAAARRQFTVGFVESVRMKLHRLVGDWEIVRRDLDRVQQTAAADFANTRVVRGLLRPDGSRDAARDRVAGRLAGQRTPVNWAIHGVAPKAIESDAE